MTQNYYLTDACHHHWQYAQTEMAWVAGSNTKKAYQLILVLT